ncbi:alpha-amylase family protein [Acidicapsa acidisoli]|uniref:alpha-amylase family protein n=1 Tax=Acidicapsa acidisoli TaxID=1615681 RepID=UPI0021E01A2A|nr:alpha-amylase family protein [Acidicapsa acidisoli]
MKSLALTRREFLQSSAVAGTGVAFTQVAPRTLWGEAALAAGVETVPAWASKPMRWFQLTLVEDDPAHFDLAFWLDYFKRTRSDAVCLSGGGCVAYYPTEIPFHHRSKWLGDRDVLGELISGCRKMGMSVLVRTDPHATYDDLQAAHPDWIAVDAEDKPRRHWATPEMWVTCAWGPYNFEFMTAVHREIMTRYRPDGIFLNRWDGSGQCYCQHCAANFKAATGFDLPRGAGASGLGTDPVRRAYLTWSRERLVSLLDLWNSEIRKINPEAAMIPNNGSGALIPLDAVETSRRAPMLAADRQSRHGLAAPWLIGKTAKEFRATMGAKPVIGLFGVGLEEPYRWKDSVTSKAEIRIWVLDAVANGMRPWCSKFSATLHDERWLKGVEELYVWTEENQRYLTHEKPLARVGLVYSQQTAWYYGDQHVDARVENYALGWYQALIESRIPFEMVHDRLLDEDRLAGFKTLILPNIAALSDAQCEQIRSFVRSGGSVVATHETSLYDELGVRRKNFGLADIFGVDWTGKAEGPMQNSYIRLEHERLPGNALFAGLEDAPRIVNGVNRLEVTPRAAFAETPFTLIPSYPDLPMEKVYPRVASTDISCLYIHKPAGRVAYFPFDIDRTFWEVLSEDHLKMMRNALLWAHDEAPMVEVAGPGLVDVTAWRNPGSITIHLVNLTNPMAMKGPYRDFFPVGAQRIRLRLLGDIPAKEARLLVAGASVPVERSGLTLTLTVPSVLDHEVVAIEV